MKMSQLLADKATIDKWDLDPVLNTLNHEMLSIENNIETFQDSELADRLMAVKDAIRDTVHSMYELQGEISALKEQASELALDKAHDPLVESYNMYETRKNWFNLAQAQKIRDDDIFREVTEHEVRFNSLIKKFTSWKYPTAYIRPNALRFFNAIKASDILYVLEHCDVTDYLKANLSETEYKMIRFKMLNENKGQYITNILPLNQLGLIVMEDFINYKPLEVIKQYLIEAIEVLRPGGSMLFTFNDCDYASGARNFEMGQYCFTPGGMVRELCELVGFEVTASEQSDRVSFLCIKKPGELTTLKGGKTLGKIEIES